MMIQIKSLCYRLTFQKTIVQMYLLRRFQAVSYEKPKKGNEFLILLKFFELLKYFCVTPPSKYRISAKSTFFVIDMKFLYKHMSKVGDDH